jgi:hypothetical protein
VHAFAAAGACVGYCCVVDDEVYVAVCCGGVFAGADDGVVFGDVEPDDFDGAGEVLGVETLEGCVPFFDGAGAEEDVPGWCGFGEELAG